MRLVIIEYMIVEIKYLFINDKFLYKIKIYIIYLDIRF